MCHETICLVSQDRVSRFKVSKARSIHEMLEWTRWDILQVARRSSRNAVMRELMVLVDEAALQAGSTKVSVCVCRLIYIQPRVEKSLTYMRLELFGTRATTFAGDGDGATSATLFGREGHCCSRDFVTICAIIEVQRKRQPYMTRGGEAMTASREDDRSRSRVSAVSE